MLDLLTSRRLHFLLAALVRIAANTTPVSGKQLAAMLHCPRRYLEPDLQALVAAGVLESRRGANGGYLLAISPHRISLLDILRCLAPDEGPGVDTNACRLQHKVIHPLLLQVQKDCHQLLEKITLASCLEQAEQSGLLSQPAATPNFSI